MKKIALGRSDIEISAIVMGCWQAGKQMWSGIDDHQIVKALHAAVDSGITTFDTAASYGSGLSETRVGDLLTGIRQKMVIATKVSPGHLGRLDVMAACEDSLRRLKTDYIDLYQIHWPSGSWRDEPIPVEETLSAMDQLKTQGKIRAIGVSNFSRAQLEEAVSITRIDAVQPPYSLLWPHALDAIAPVCTDNAITVLAYSPMAQGLLSGRFLPGHRFGKKDHRKRNKLVSPTFFPLVADVVRRLSPVADAHGLTCAQLALAWVISRPGTAAIAGARSPDQVRENADAGRVELTEATRIALAELAVPVTGKLDSNPVQWTY
ncbi:MAG: aldo/keto reductase [Deltaproteobacteria bacterium]|nr:MAG: aldo/keto reductase [Deltaproteobacteria bacterium]